MTAVLAIEELQAGAVAIRHKKLRPAVGRLLIRGFAELGIGILLVGGTRGEDHALGIREPVGGAVLKFVDGVRLAGRSVEADHGPVLSVEVSGAGEVLAVGRPEELLIDPFAVQRAHYLLFCDVPDFDAGLGQC